MLGQLFDILPVLALVGLGLTGIENATVSDPQQPPFTSLPEEQLH
jgi:hypothetical protein